MAGQVEADVVVKALKRMLDETYADVQGAYLDKNTSLLESLDAISASEASQPVSPRGTSIAAHVEHVRFYLNEVLWAAQHGPRDIDWEKSWAQAQVNDAEWAELKANLRTTYEQMGQLMGSLTPELIALHLTGAISVIAHSAYHLGAIRQIQFVVGK